MIQYLKHKEINLHRWDSCIEQSVTPLVYAKSWYLNMICPGWDALVLNEYEAVMPLTKGKKYFIHYLYQPFFSQQLGVFSAEVLTAQQLLAFINAIPKHFRFIDINLNSSNKALADVLHLKPRKNYELNLNKPYDKLEKNYASQAKRNLKKAQKEILIIKNIPYPQAVEFYRKHKGKLTKGVKEKHYQQLMFLLEKADQYKHVFALGSYNSKQEILAAAIFIHYHSRIIFLLGTASPAGRDCGAMYAIFDRLIFQYAGTDTVLDFEGSEIPGIARFFKNFGAEKKIYYKLKINRLPLLFKIFKR